MSSFGLVMISAAYENGGNVLHRHLDGHPELLVYPFESQVGTAFAQDHLTSFVPPRYRWPEFPVTGDAADDYESFWDEELKTLLRAPGRSKFRDCGLRMDEEARKARFVEIAKAVGRTRAGLVEAFFRSTFDAWSNHQSTGREKYYVGFNPMQVLDAEKVLADFPNGHVIHIVRNPWSAVADHLRRPFPLDLERYAHTWAYAQHLALTYLDRYAGRFHLVRFEDLVENTERTIGGIEDVLGIERSPSALYPSFNGEPLVGTAPWGSIAMTTAEENLAAASRLGDEQQRVVRELTGVPLRLLGYGDFLSTGTLAPIAR
jgi:hypothetical protein